MFDMEKPKKPRSIISKVVEAMMPIIAVIILCVLAFGSTKSHASCIRGDLISNNKVAHATGTFAATVVITALTKNDLIGAGAGILAGAYREGQKIMTPGESCEWSSMAYDAVGVVMGFYIGEHWIVAPTKGGASVQYSRGF